MTMTNEDMRPPTDEQIADFPHDDILDVRDLLDDEDTAPVIVAALMDAGLARDADSARDYAKNEPIMVEDGYFEDYARELAEDIGAIDRDASWPNSYIDWEAAAEALLQDYCPVDVAGRRYWARSF